MRAAQLRDGGQKVPAQVDAVPVREADVEHRDVGLHGGYPGHCCCDGVGFAHNVEFRIGVEQLNESLPDQIMVVDEEHGDHAAIGRQI